MKILKGFALSILGFLLFSSLLLFSVGLTLNFTLLKPEFLVSQINRIDFASLSQDIFSNNQDFPDELRTSLTGTISELEPQIKTQMGFAVHSVYDYLLGKKDRPELADTLRNTVLSQNTIAAAIDKVSIATLANNIIQSQFDKQMPAGLPPDALKVIKESLGPAIKKAEPEIKDKLKSATGPVLDYLFGKSRTFSVTVNLDTIVNTLKDDIKASLLKSPPPELAAVPVAQRSQYIDTFFAEFTRGIPSYFTIDQTMIGAAAPASIAKTMRKAETGLATGRVYIGYFKTGFTLLMVLMALLIIGIIFLHRQVRGATRSLGVIFLTFGITEFAGVFLLKSLLLPIASAEMPGNLATSFIPGLLSDLLLPFQALTLGLMVLGAILVVVSFIYRPRPPSPATACTEQASP